MKHQRGELQQLQMLSLGSKERMSVKRIDDFTDTYDCYVSGSGGKDSEVLWDLAQKSKNASDIPYVYVRTGLDYPEVTKQALSHRNVIELRPEKSFLQIIKEFGYPVISKDVSNIIYGARHSKNKKQNYINRLNGLDSNGNPDPYKEHNYKKWKFLLDAPFEISNRCCYYMKEKPCIEFERETGRKPIVGTMACESKQRLDGWLKTGCNSYDGDRPMSKPISFWTEQDILKYLLEYEHWMMQKLIEFNEEKGLETTQPHPWATVYGDIRQKPDKKQVTGQMDFFDEICIPSPTDNLETTGCDRTGCMFCMYGCHCAGDERFVRMKQTHPQSYDYIMRGGKFENGLWKPHNGLGFKFVIDWLNENGGLNIKY